MILEKDPPDILEWCYSILKKNDWNKNNNKNFFK
jgi:hypothetical protein